MFFWVPVFSCPKAVTTLKSGLDQPLKKKTPGDIILHLCNNNLHDMIYSSWDWAWQTKIGNYGSLFALLPSPLPPKHPKNQNFERMKKTAGYITILHKCTRNHNHRSYSFWDMEWNTQIFLSFWAIFCHLTPLTTGQKQKKHLEMSSFYTCVPKITIIWCMLSEI